MTIGKMTALGLGLVGAFALGVWTGPHITQRADPTASAVHDTVAIPEARDEATAAREARNGNRAAAARAAAARAAGCCSASRCSGFVAAAADRGYTAARTVAARS
jgi:hypothetical protein